MTHPTKPQGETPLTDALEESQRGRLDGLIIEDVRAAVRESFDHARTLERALFECRNELEEKDAEIARLHEKAKMSGQRADDAESRLASSEGPDARSRWFWCERHEKAEEEGTDTGECLLVGPFITKQEAESFPAPSPADGLADRILDAKRVAIAAPTSDKWEDLTRDEVEAIYIALRSHQAPRGDDSCHAPEWMMVPKSLLRAAQLKCVDVGIQEAIHNFLTAAPGTEKDKP